MFAPVQLKCNGERHMTPLTGLIYISQTKISFETIMVPDIHSLTSQSNGSPIFLVSNFTASLLNSPVFLFHINSHLMKLLLPSLTKLNQKKNISTHSLYLSYSPTSICTLYSLLLPVTMALQEASPCLACQILLYSTYPNLHLLFYSYIHIQFIRKLSHLYLQNISSIPSFLITSRATTLDLATTTNISNLNYCKSLLAILLSSVFAC